jgi:serine protease AprX
MRALAAIALSVLGAVATPSAHASAAQDVYGVTQAQTEAPDLDGAGLVVAVVDTGVDGTHPALAGRVIGSVDLSPPSSGSCDFGHATWVAGIIAGAATEQQPAGVAPEAEIVSVKAVNSCHESTLQHIADGINWATDHREQYGIDVVNLSVGDPTPSGPETDVAEAAVDRAVAHGLTVVTAAGNQPGLGMVATPASAERAITAGAMIDPQVPASVGGPGFRPAPISSSGPVAEERVKPDVMAPSVHPAAGGEMKGGGTSGAAAFTSGVALLMLDANPDLTPADVKARMMASAQDWGRPGVDEDYGAGRLDAYAALQAAGAPLTTPPVTPAHRIFPGRAAPGAPVPHELVVTDDATPLAVTLLPDPPDRLPDGAPAELDLHLQGPGGVDQTAPADHRLRTLALEQPVPGTYTVTVSAPAGAASYALDVSGALSAAAAAPALTLDSPVVFTNDPTPLFSGRAGTAAGDLPGVAARVYRNGVQVRSLWALPAGDGRWSTEPATALPDGTYQVGAEQGSAAGTPARPARATFTIDTAAPDTTLSRSGTTFTFGSEPGARFECSGDGGAWSACTSPLSREGLAPGPHSLAVRAVDPAGNWDPTPETRSWTVEAPPPAVPPPAAPAPDTDAPEVTLAATVSKRLALLRGRGLLVPLRCDEACSLRAELRLAPRVARQLRVPARLAKAAAELTDAGTYELRLRPSRRNRLRLRRARLLRLTLVVVASDAAGNEERLSLTLKLR